MYTWTNKDLQLIIDVTTYCNAKCPQCSRTDPNSGGLPKTKYLPLMNWTLSDIQAAYPKEQLRDVAYIQMCPTWGDAMMNPEIYEITKYFLENMKPRSGYEIITNGSMRDEEFWFNFTGLGIIAKDRRMHFGICFDVDGIDQEMHSRYRRNTDLSKVLRNMKMFSSNPRNMTRSQSVIFKHNQDYTEEIKKLAYENGSTNHAFVKSSRFEMDKSRHGTYQPRYFKNENHEWEYLEWADKEFEKPYMSLIEDPAIIQHKVACKWSIKNTLNINFDGQVWPCCYFGSANYEKWTGEFLKNDIIKEYNLLAKEHNVKYTPLRDILKSTWYRESLPKSIDEAPISQCLRQCSNQIRPTHMLEIRSHEGIIT